MLEISKLTFAYPGQARPYRFDLTAAPGEIVAITGKSGSGKSTLLDLIAGFLAPASGAVRLDGQSLLEAGPESRPVSILFQADNLFDHLSVADNLALGLAAGLPGAERDRAIREGLEEVGMADYRTRLAARLSGGQKQRVALARTLLRDRPVLLLDEPFASLDPETANDMRELLRRLAAARDWHTLVVSHLPEDASMLADRAYWLAEFVLSEVAPVSAD